MPTFSIALHLLHFITAVSRFGVSMLPALMTWLKTAFLTEHRSASGSGTTGKLTVQQIQGSSVIFQAEDMAKPAQASLSKQVVHA
ncbi:hypothetical protein PoB_006358700 [Plakobranchus ocellatus]|uniref:Secreted protein n=1 Tax=Plakobranchus ocellatus TaxID=259542 RepID=A0AAV4CYT4_9GAST|nr:hypothetical protein PoB_006358700 [Plakobranchus ocellatus]